MAIGPSISFPGSPLRIAKGNRSSDSVAPVVKRGSANQNHGISLLVPGMAARRQTVDRLA